jgi:multidrug efflux system outer membrane protein
MDIRMVLIGSHSLRKGRVMGHHDRVEDIKGRKEIPEASEVRRRWRFVSLLVTVFLLLIVGCMKLGPDFHRPDTGIRVPDSYQQSPKQTETSPIEGPWWHAFGDPDLNRMVEEALKNNLDLKRAAARILEVRTRVIQARADRLPELDLQMQAQRRRSTVDVTTSLQTQQVRLSIDTFNLSLPASFELDLWGRLARNEEAAWADLLEAEESRLTLAQTVVAETISLYFLMESLERQIEITESSIDNYRRSADFIENRYKRGLSSILDVRQARRTLMQAESLLPSQRQDLGIVQQKLAVLLGRYPETKPVRKQPEEYFKQLAPVPPGLPSELLTRRPDIMTAEARLKALNARIGVAKASRFPRISLTGSYGYSSGELNELFAPSSELWSLAAGLFQPVFDGGRLKAGQEAAEARYEQGVMEYAKTVLTAFAEVEGALLTRREQLEKRERVLAFLTEARATQEVAESRYVKGLADYLTVLVAQQTRFNAEVNLVLVDLAILTNRVTLYRSLGGGWAVPASAGPNINKITIRDYMP